MCLIAFAHRAVSGAALVVAANRDELFERPTAAARFWEDHPSVLAGRDLRAGGTWMGVTRSGRFAAITNFRNPRDRRNDAPSRGALVGDFLTGTESPQRYLERLRPRAKDYNGFSVLVATPEAMWFYSNSNDALLPVEPGVHALSNHVLDEPWPKVRKAREGVRALLGTPLQPEQLFDMLADETTAPDEELPDTGIGLGRERKASAMRIRDPFYGTRCSTVLIVRGTSVIFQERSFTADGGTAGTVRYEFAIEPAGAPS